ncbi:MAG: NRDE family protein [Pseudomonadales bacterium]|nr:NRDE family protein [Pseudomonadales bacterium]
MCLILFAVNPNAQHRLVIAANRDELYARPTTDADFWGESPGVLAGRDQQMGGTWLGVNRRGCFAAVTNFKEDPPDPIPPRSRGELPADFLRHKADPHQYVMGVAENAHAYRGFNLIVADSTACWYYGNRAGTPRRLDTGTYGLSNQVLDCDWPKVIEGRQRLTDLLEEQPEPNTLIEGLFGLLLHSGDARAFSNSFIKANVYGTRAATVVTIDHNGDVYFEERNFAENGIGLGSNSYLIKSNGDS